MSFNLGPALENSGAVVTPGRPPANSRSAVFPDVDSKDPSFTTTKTQRIVPRPSRNFRLPSWSKLEVPFWAAMPLFLGLAATALLAGAIWQEQVPYMSLHQVGGTGRLDYYILGACAVAPNTTEVICGPRAINADFVPSLRLISPGVAGYALFKLPLYSSQSQVVFLSGFLSMLVSMAVLLPAWTLAYFPKAPMPVRMSEFIRLYPWWIYTFSGVFSFVAMVLTVTIGIGYKMLMLAGIHNYALWEQQAFLFKLDLPGQTKWIGSADSDAWGLVYAAVFFQALYTIGINAALHNRIDERIERGGESNGGNDYMGY